MVAFYGYEMKSEKFNYIIGLNRLDLIGLVTRKSIRINGKVLKTDKDFFIYAGKDDKELFERFKGCIDDNTEFTYEG